MKTPKTGSFCGQDRWHTQTYETKVLSHKIHVARVDHKEAVKTNVSVGTVTETWRGSLARDLTIFGRMDGRLLDKEVHRGWVGS